MSILHLFEEMSLVLAQTGDYISPTIEMIADDTLAKNNLRKSELTLKSRK